MRNSTKEERGGERGGRVRLRASLADPINRAIRQKIAGLRDGGEDDLTIYFPYISRFIPYDLERLFLIRRREIKGHTPPR